MDKNLLKKEYGIIWLVVGFFTEFITTFLLAYFLDVYDREAWYTKPAYWIVGFVFFMFPALIMFLIFQVQIAVGTARKLNVPGEEIYGNIFIWVAGIVVPVFGWLFLAAMYFYVNVVTYIMLISGEGERYI